MASITVRVVDGQRRVTVRGHLEAGDLRRLERACGPALEHRELPLQLHVRDVVDIDGASRHFLEGLVKRGAVLA